MGLFGPSLLRLKEKAAALVFSAFCRLSVVGCRHQHRRFNGPPGKDRRQSGSARPDPEGRGVNKHGIRTVTHV